MDAEDAVSSARLDMISDLVVDLRNMMTGICYNPDFSLALLEEWRETSKLRERMEGMEAFLNKSSGQWWAGDKLTWGDFLLWEVLDHHRYIEQMK